MYTNNLNAINQRISVQESYPQLFITPEEFGAMGDMATDDIIAIEKAEGYAMDKGIELRMFGRYRITRSWVIGYKYLQEINYKQDPIQGDTNVIDDTKKPIHITFGSNAIIYGDFVTEQLMAIVYYYILPWRTTADNRSGGEAIFQKFNNVKIKGKGKAGKQIGFMAVDAYGLMANNFNVIDCELGVALNSCYFSELRNFTFGNNQQDFYCIEQNAGKISCFKSDSSYKAYEFGGTAMVIESLNTERCYQSLDISGLSNSYINGIYFERHINTDIYKIITGLCDGVTINSAILSAVTGAPDYAPTNLLHVGSGTGRFRLNDSTGSGNILNESETATVDVLGNYKNIQGTIN